MQNTSNQPLLEQAARCWLAMADFRSSRERNKRYCFGRQWDDIINVDGHRMTEEDYIRSQGNVPLKNNLIRRLVRSVIGVYRNQYKFPEPDALGLVADSDSDCALYRRLQRHAEENMLTELHARTMEEFLISGLAVHRKSLSQQHRVLSLRTDHVAPDTFFVDPAARDFRGSDTRILGQIHDIDILTLTGSLARSRSEALRIRHHYGEVNDTGFGQGNTFEIADSRMRDFYTPSAPGLCRVIEIWTKEGREVLHVHDRLSGRIFSVEPCREREFADGCRFGLRWGMEERWHYHFLTPSGVVLASGESPLAGGEHPYTWRAYPFLDGEIHSFVADVIDQQRHTNRLITLYDWVLRSTAKGVLLFPESALPDGVEIDDISDQWSRFNGVILFRPKAGMPLPQQVTGNASQVGITDLLNIQLSMFEDVSGVSGALEGKLKNGSVSGKLYDQQTRQALVALLDILESYNSFALQSARFDAAALRHKDLF